MKLFLIRSGFHARIRRAAMASAALWAWCQTFGFEELAL